MKRLDACRFADLFKKTKGTNTFITNIRILFLLCSVPSLMRITSKRNLFHALLNIDGMKSG